MNASLDLLKEAAYTFAKVEAAHRYMLACHAAAPIIAVIISELETAQENLLDAARSHYRDTYGGEPE